MLRSTTNKIKTLLIFLCLLLVLIPGQAVALSGEQKKLYRSGIYYYDKGVTECGALTVAVANPDDLSSDSTLANRSAIFTAFTQKYGLTAQQAAGIMGNIKEESGFEPRRVQYGTLNSRGEVSRAGSETSYDDNVPTSSGGYGLVQWTYPPYKDKLRELAKQKGVIAGDLNLQIDYIFESVNADIMSEIKASTSIEDATKIFLFKFEKPANMESKYPTRLEYAKAILQEFGGGVPGGSSSCGGLGLAGETGWDLSGANSMVYYAQNDPKWATKPFGICTIAKGGCGPTSVAMIAATLNSDRSIIPPDVASYYASNGGSISGDCGSNWKWDILASKYGLTLTDLGTNFAEAANTLKSGGLVLVSVGNGTFTDGGHLMVIRKVSQDGSSFYIADPYSEGGATNGESNTKAYTIDELRGAGALRNMWGFTK